MPFSEDLPAYIRITDIDDDGRFVPAPRVSVYIEPSDDQFLQPGDIVLARTGASVGKSYRYRVEDGRLVFAGFLIRVRPNLDRLVPEFLSAYLSTWSYWDWVRLTSARSGQPGINGSEYASMPLTMPTDAASLLEQRKIADCFAVLDESNRCTTAKASGVEMSQERSVATGVPDSEGDMTNVEDIATQLRDDAADVQLLYAFNSVGKTRLSVAYKNTTKDADGRHAGIYYNAYSEDLFVWNNDVENGEANIRITVIPSSLSRLHADLNELDIHAKLEPYRPSFDFRFVMHPDAEKGIESISFFPGGYAARRRSGDEDLPRRGASVCLVFLSSDDGSGRLGG